MLKLIYFCIKGLSQQQMVKSFFSGFFSKFEKKKIQG